MRKISLNGEYLLRFCDQQENPEGLEGMQTIPATVPGNVEIDLMRAGILPDIFFGNNIKLLKPYEFYRWRYEREFTAPEIAPGERAYLAFQGVDCFAAYFLNGEKFAESDNALIAHRFEVTSLLKPGVNRLAVELSSPMLAAAEFSYDAYNTHLDTNYESLRVRKAPSCYGWDIMPRTLSAGLWRNVDLEIEGPNEIKDLFFSVRSLNKKSAILTCVYKTHSDAKYFAGLQLRINGTCGESSFTVVREMHFVSGRFDFEITNPLLWWPNGYGSANVYDVKAELLKDGQVVAEYFTSFGVRTVKLDRTDITDSYGGEFCFIVNGEKILCKGSNWVPADALHSRDASRYEKMLELWVDTGCNIIRTWGGGVYEDHSFFDFCDRHGIMVWQDFVMACGTYPIDEDFLAVIRKEAEAVVTKLRNHPSIILWSGDNECDSMTLMMAEQDPKDNRITREVLPQVVTRIDPYREYLPSSPYISPAVTAHGLDYYRIDHLLPENHLWGPRDYFKSAYYTGAPCHFVSETGYHGCNSLSSIRNFISPDKLWPWQDNDEWLTHAAEMTGPDGRYAYRIRLMANQIRELFGFEPDNLEDFILASQISQAEAKKFFIELTRAKKWRRTGIIWWNMIDGWPQFSDAVVSYDFIKKLAYYYIKRSQAPLCLFMSEPENWHINLIAGNDTFHSYQGHCRAWDSDTGETLFAGPFEAPVNQSAVISPIRISHGDQRLILIEWEVGDKRGANHYILGKPPLSFEQYKEWLKKIAALDNLFDADAIGK
ncbi:MAG: glycoside hydrolase family 2 [Clostridiaceae bacterium]|nr:glycoside hydrolase family 2 [Clostridiaceae bacterium]